MVVNQLLHKHLGVQIFEASGDVVYDEEAAHLLFSVPHDMLIDLV